MMPLVWLMLLIAYTQAFRNVPLRLLRTRAPNTRTSSGTVISSLLAKMGFGASSVTKDEVEPGDVKGTSLRVLKYPHPQLRAENAAITEFDAELKTLAEEMLMVMYAAEGIGLAAPQVGINKRLMVFNEHVDKPEKEMVLVNPRITAVSPETDVLEEGCLSFPLINGDVQRHKWVDVEYFTLSGEKKQLKFKDYQARIFQHEYDHLDRVLFIDKLVPLDKKLNQKRLDKAVKKYGPGAAP